MKNIKTWFRAKSIEITKNYLKYPYEFMEATLTLTSEPESTGKIHKNDLKLELYGLEDENSMWVIYDFFACPGQQKGPVKLMNTVHFHFNISMISS